MPNPTSQPRKRRILILGGGMASLTAAWELTRRPDWKNHFDITILQMGWRLGGKTATGRGVHGRIEEHGIHILQGWYENTFRLLQRVFEERHRLGLTPPSSSPHWPEAFVREHATLLTEYVPELEQWTSWQLVLPWNDQIPGRGPSPTTREMMRKAIALILELCLGAPADPQHGPLASLVLDTFFPPDLAGQAPLHAPQADEGTTERQPILNKWVWKKATALVHALDRSERLHRSLLGPLGEIVRWFDRKTRKKRLEVPRLRHAWSLVEAAFVGLKGALLDLYEPGEDRFHWRRVDDLDFRDWLAKHGASPELLASPMVRFVYTGTFSNMPTADAPRGRIAAGTAMRFVVKSLGFKGSFVWKFKAGTGDTLVGPLFQVLRARGVRFEFFRKVESLHVEGEPGRGHISAVTIQDQADVLAEEYDPLMPLGDAKVWPSQPLWEQLDPAQAHVLQEKQIDLECPWTDWTGIRTRTLCAGEDFDEVILGIPVSALRTIAANLMERDPRWKNMVENIATVGTHAVQLWLHPTITEMGMDVTQWGMAPGTEPNLVTYADPLYSWLEMTSVCAAESWPSDKRPGTILYFTGWMRDEEPLPLGPAPEHAKRLKDRGIAIAATWLSEHAGWLFPKATPADNPRGFDLSLLVDPTGQGTTGLDKLKEQYHRSNVDFSSRYTLALPGTARYRLRADDSGWQGLWLCGDWIDYGMNVGYVEGAVTSGAQAARSVWNALGLPRVEDIFVDMKVE